MSNEQNPLIPAGYDIVWSVIAVVLLALMILALVSLARSAKRLNGTQGLVWTLVVIFVPVIGPLAWLSIGRRADSVQQNN
ncbi:PLD nuclease N-terminal domain-containing protein [Microbacterium aurum]